MKTEGRRPGRKIAPSRGYIIILLYYYIIITYRPLGRTIGSLYIYIFIYSFFFEGGRENKTHTEQAKHEQHKKNHEIFLNVLKISSDFRRNHEVFLEDF